ncbi:uncharacterized protein LOC118575067 [Onychomys torridus]|uniref:uncharacterized protein LOC118575067 n=1 Tax=Onychomys torridus TaxID=38674 RepID=UPI00167F97AB|nr:uncharacterized protein LOC118575067 [Onychomys torridus]
MDVQGVPEEELPKTQLATPIPQSAEQNTSTAPDPPSLHLHMNIGVNSEVHRMEAVMSQPFPSNRDEHQELRYNPLVISMGPPSPRNFGVNIIQEEKALVKKDSKHMSELNIEQRVIQTKIQIRMAQLIPESGSEVIDSEGFSPQLSDQAETVSITPQPLNQVIEPINPSSASTMELKSMASRLSQVTDNQEVTPVALFHAMDSMGMIDKLSPHVIELIGIAPKAQCQVMESVKTDNTAYLSNHKTREYECRAKADSCGSCGNDSPASAWRHGNTDHDLGVTESSHKTHQDFFQYSTSKCNGN